jgi:hypothetical protein
MTYERGVAQSAWRGPLTSVFSRTRSRLFESCQQTGTAYGAVLVSHHYKAVSKDMSRTTVLENLSDPLAAVLLVLVLALTPAIANPEILWSGDYETGNFLQWHMQDDSSLPHFSAIPAYGRPKNSSGYGERHESYYGDGSLLEIVTSPVRQGKYAAKFTVKNSKSGVEPDDCDVPLPSCNRRRTDLTVHGTLPRYYNAMPYMSERWMSVSHFIPSDWDSGGKGFGPLLFSVKPLNESGLSGNFSIEISDNAWIIWNRWSDVRNPAKSDVPWQQQMFYAGNYDGQPYPRSDNWPDGMADFPNVAASHDALRSLNKGGWTDWVIHVNYDARGKSSGGKGFLTVWKREDSGPWVKVLHVLPKSTTRGGVNFDHGIGYNSPPGGGSNPGGFGIKAGMYMAKGQVWDLSRNRMMYNDNIKVGSQKATFAMMSPDGSSPGDAAQGRTAPPRPPDLGPVE